MLACQPNQYASDLAYLIIGEPITNAITQLTYDT